MLGAFAAASAFAAPSEVTQRNVGDGIILADAKGMTLYRFDMDKESGKSACADACAKAWPPLIASAGAKPAAPWSLLSRGDGSRQWAYDGKPLYTYVQDKKPGDANGNGIMFNLWHTVFLPMNTPPGITVQRSGLGNVLADAAGMTLYITDRDQPGLSRCDQACAETWLPLAAPSLGNPIGDWSTIRREDGISQWAWRGRPLYRHAGDFKPGATNGDGKDGSWHVALLRPLPLPPPGLRYEPSDLGRIVADAAGRTLYTLSESADRPKVCDDACIEANWRPAIVPAPVANLGPGWSVMKRADGTFQWAYKGKLVYTYRLDEKPGDIRGDRFGNMSSGGFAPWDPIQPEF
jgi:predicted lipoprotein with Yx(FWY)xxD motif